MISLPSAAALVRERTGLVFNDARRASFERAITAAMKRARVRDVNDYLSRLAAQSGLLDDLVAEITVGETYFFREPRQLDLIRNTILPDLISRRPAGHGLRIWSAGCATGEEAYTLAIIAREFRLEPQPHILATDLSRAALARAARARYGRWSLRGVSDAVVETHFEQQGDAFLLDPAVRSAVEFGYLNLAADAYPSLATGIWGMDLILCRNVLIYFDRETAARVARRLVHSLAEGGWLVMGASDPLVGEVAGCEVVVTEAGLVYRRGGGSLPRANRSTEAGTTVADRSTDSGTTGVDRSTYSGTTVPDGVPRESAPPRAEDAPSHRADAAEAIASVRSLANRGDLEQAGRQCAAALELHRDSAELLYLHAVLLAEAGRHADSARAARGALYLDRELIVAHVALGNALARAGDTPAARRALRNAERLLSAMPPDAAVPASDGEPAARLSEMVRMRLTLLTEMAA